MPAVDTTWNANLVSPPRFRASNFWKFAATGKLFSPTDAELNNASIPLAAISRLCTVGRVSLNPDFDFLNPVAGFPYQDFHFPGKEIRFRTVGCPSLSPENHFLNPNNGFPDSAFPVPDPENGFLNPDHRITYQEIISATAGKPFGVNGKLDDVANSIIPSLCFANRAAAYPGLTVLSSFPPTPLSSLGN